MLAPNAELSFRVRIPAAPNGFMVENFTHGDVAQSVARWLCNQFVAIGFGSNPRFRERFLSRSQLCADSPRCPNIPVCTHAQEEDPKLTAKVSGLGKHEDSHESSLVSLYRHRISTREAYC
ncbi:hypothetical protein V1264_000242 [Littorina saxatilis]|uniref:Uncharacterized protein n=1 Tax=Littorina saxatilis TaxID=31220 RepID=A0AAN9BYY0_9CAEN